METEIKSNEFVRPYTLNRIHNTTMRYGFFLDFSFNVIWLTPLMGQESCHCLLHGHIFCFIVFHNIIKVKVHAKLFIRKT